MSTAALYALTHVASQLIYRWLAPPSADDEAAVAAAEPLATWGSADWQAVLAADQARTEPRLRWFRDYEAKRDEGARRLVEATREHLRRLDGAGGVYLQLCDPRYPPALRQIADPPLGLSALGDLDSLLLPAISVVGSRKASGRAMQASFDLGRALGAAGQLVVSGGALGCDIAAHHGVLASPWRPAPAACVFAGGLAELYPRTNGPVFRRLRTERALLLSERLWQAACRPLDFTARNRIISGLGQVTVVMQAALRSGALVTARLALDQGREVAVYRHPADDIRAAGSEALLADGAWGFNEAGEVLAAFAGRP